MFNILKNLFNDSKLKNCDNEKSTDQIDDTTLESEKHITPVINKIDKKEFSKDFDKDLKLSSDSIDIFKGKQFSHLNNEVKEETVFSPINQELFNLMKDQLKEKDLQICRLSEILTHEQDLHKNTQILFKQQQSKQDLAWPKNDLDQRIENIETSIAKRKEQKHKGFFGI